MVYLIVALFILVSIVRYDINGSERGKYFSYYFTMVMLILVAGFRWRLGSDTPTYMYIFYHETPRLKALAFDDLGVKYPMWNLLNSLILTLCGKFYVLQIIHAIFVNTLYFKYIRKHSPYIFSCVLIYYIWMFTNQNMETMKASMSIVVCLFGNDYMLERKWKKGLILYLIACSFHVSAALIIVTPLFFFLRFNYLAVIIFILTFIAGTYLQSVFGDYVMMLEFDGDIQDKLVGYANSDVYGSQKNFNYFIVNILPFFLYAWVSVVFLKKRENNESLLQLEPLLIIGLVFMIFKMNFFIFYRFAQFYYIYFVLFFVQQFYNFVNNSKGLKIDVAVCRAFILMFPIIYVLSGYSISRLPMYYPYTSIINRKIIKEREREFSQIGHFIPFANRNEY